MRTFKAGYLVNPDAEGEEGEEGEKEYAFAVSCVAPYNKEHFVVGLSDPNEDDEECAVLMYHVDDPSPVRTFKGHDGSVNALAVSGDHAAAARMTGSSRCGASPRTSSSAPSRGTPTR